MPELPEVETVRIGLSSLLPGKVIKSVNYDWPGSKPGEYIYYSADLDSGSIVNFSRQSILDTPPKKNSQYSSEQDHQKQQNTHQAYSKSFPNAETDVKQFVVGAKILEVKRRGKVLIIELSTKYSLIVHLKMTGQLVFRTNDDKQQFGAGHPSNSLIGELPDKSTRVILFLEEGITSAPESSARKQRSAEQTVQVVQRASTKVADTAIGVPEKYILRGKVDQERWRSFGLRPKAGQGGAKLFFNDQRKFGWMRLVPTAEIPNIDFFKKIGPEPLSDTFKAKDFIQRVMLRPKSNIKAVLLDQSILAGVGNIYADESLYAAKIHPETKPQNLSDRALFVLFEELQKVLRLSIEKGGSSDRNYVDIRGRRGSYLGFAKVFRKNGQPCGECGTIIEKIRVAGRGTHICPKCQLKPRKI